MIVVRIDKQTAVLLLVGIAVLVLHMSQALALTRDLWTLTKSIHWSLVQAPLEAALNSERADTGSGE